MLACAGNKKRTPQIKPQHGRKDDRDICQTARIGGIIGQVWLRHLIKIELLTVSLNACSIQSSIRCAHFTLKQLALKNEIVIATYFGNK